MLTGAHPGHPGHVALALRSAGVRAAPPLWSPSRLQETNQLQTPDDHLGKRGWGVIADQLDPSFCLECTLFLFMSNKMPLPFLPLFLFAICPPLFWGVHLSNTCDEGYFLFVRGEQYDTEAHHACVCVRSFMYGTFECQLTNTQAYTQPAA